MANRLLKDILDKAINLKQEDAFRQDIYYLAQKVFSLSYNELFLNANNIYDDKLFNKYLERYLKGKPLYYILKEAPFFGRMFEVNQNVLIPRNETEELILIVKNKIREFSLKKPHILDVGTGSGCIAITLKNEISDSEVTGVDISPLCIDIAKKNSEKNNAKVNYYLSDCLDEVIRKNEKFDILVSNPPYIDRDTFVEKSVLNYEPHLALFADNHGLAIYEKIFKDLNKVLEKKAFCIFEISPDLEKGLVNLINKYIGSYGYEFIKDINGFTRFLYLFK